MWIRNRGESLRSEYNHSRVETLDRIIAIFSDLRSSISYNCSIIAVDSDTKETICRP